MMARILVVLTVLLVARGAAAEINGGRTQYYCDCLKEETTGWWLWEKTTNVAFPVHVNGPNATCGIACNAAGGSAEGGVRRDVDETWAGQE